MSDEIPMSTRDVARALGLNLRAVDNACRMIPLDELPPVVNGRRLWMRRHLERLRAFVVAQEARRSSKGAR